MKYSTSSHLLAFVVGALGLCWSGIVGADELSNIFAATPLIHILGPSPAISPSTDTSAVDSLMLESCDVLKDLDTYYWYYHARSQDQERWPHGYRLCVATAPTRLGPWTKYEHNPILDQGPDDSWDHGSVYGAIVLKEGAYNIAPKTERYYMWYGSDAEGGSIGLATADHPLGPWTKYAGNPVLRDFGYPGGVIRKGNKFYMFAQHPIGKKTDQGPFEVATADKPEGPWTRYTGNPVMTSGDWGAWDDGGYSEARVTYHEGLFHMFYGGTKTPKLESIGYAYSRDGLEWIKYQGNPVVSSDSVPDASGLAEVHGYIEGSYVYLYHTLRYYTGTATARGVSSYRRVTPAAFDAQDSHRFSHVYDLYDTEWKTEDLGIQILTLDSHFKVAFPILMLDSLGAGRSSRLEACLPVGLQAASTAAITMECTYGPTPRAGVRLHVRGSYDGVHYDTEDLYTFNIESHPRQTITKTVELRPATRFAKAFLENLDVTQEVVGIKLTVTVGN
jgi:hypothetical protein